MGTIDHGVTCCFEDCEEAPFNPTSGRWLNQRTGRWLCETHQAARYDEQGRLTMPD